MIQGAEEDTCLHSADIEMVKLRVVPMLLWICCGKRNCSSPSKQQRRCSNASQNTHSTNGSEQLETAVLENKAAALLL